MIEKLAKSQFGGETKNTRCNTSGQTGTQEQEVKHKKKLGNTFQNKTGHLNMNTKM